MSAKGNTYETDLLELILNNVGMALVGDATGILPSGTNGSLYVGLHTADPGEAGTQQTSEATYTGYARVAVARNPSSKQWTVASGAATNAADITFAICTAGSNSITHFTLGTAASGAGKVLYYGAVGTPLAVSVNITPRIPAGDLDIAEL